MLCCVSRRTVSGADQGSLYDHYLTKVQPVESEKVAEVEKDLEPDVPSALLPCAFCARTFMPQSLEKHTRICEQTASKRRKPFDSAKQRIQGTELAEFLPKQEKRRQTQDDRNRSTWKQTHDDFLRQIRAARNEIVDGVMQKQSATVLSSSAPTRANEQGVCPTCNRHFGVKAYDRHVAWCKDRIAKVPMSPATNIAKERLEARMKYRAPSLKNRRQITRDKYSPNSASNFHSNKTSPTQPASRAKESISVPNCTKVDSPIKQKPATVRRAGPSKSSPIGPMKSRPIDRSNRPPEDESEAVPLPPVLHNKRTLLPVPPLKYKKQSLGDCSDVSTPRRKTRKMVARDQPPSCRSKSEAGQQPLHSGRSIKSNIVSARSEGHPKLNDISINVEVTGMTVTPCSIFPKTKLTTWKRISQEKEDDAISVRSAKVPGHFVDSRVRKSNVILEGSVDGIAKSSPRSGNDADWSPVTPRLNRTYSFKESFDEANEPQLHQSKWRPVRHSPRVEFCVGDIDKLERLRSRYQRKEEERRTDEGDSKTDDNFEDLSCEEKALLNRRMSTGRFKSKRTRMLERKRLNLCAQLSPDNQDEMGNHPSGSENVCSETITSDGINDVEACDDFDRKVGDTGEESFSPAKLSSPIVSARFNAPVQLNSAREYRSDAIVDGPLSGRLSRGMYRPGTVELQKVREEIEANEVDNSLAFDESSFPANYNDIAELEAGMIEMETEPVLMKDVLRPSRSSTPFEHSSRWKEPEDLWENSVSPPSNKWEMTINEETGSERLYRVELDETGGSIVAESGQTNIDDQITGQRCSTATRCTNDEEDRKQVKVQAVDRKDIATQAATCKCTLKVIDASPERFIDRDRSWKSESFDESRKIDEGSMRTPVAGYREIEVYFPIERTISEETDADYREDGVDVSQSRFTNSIIEKINLAGEEVKEIYNNSSSKDFDCDSEDSADEIEMPEPRCAYIRDNLIDVRNLRSMILSESHVTVKKSSNAAFKSRYSKVIGIENRFLENVSEMNDSNDSLMDGVDVTGVKQVETVEVETIEEIGTGHRNVRFGMLPEIKRTTIMVRKDNNKSEAISAQTYWERANASRNRLINLDLPCQEAGRVVNRNTKVHALPPVSSSALFTRSSGKDYNPFLLAEQQMNDLLSDASEQSVTDSPVLAQNRETSFPLSHSSAFVKYPYPTSLNPGKRSSLIAPPTEFDDLASDFSSDSTETNSLCREVYLKDEKDTKPGDEKKSPVRELGRRVIIDKSKALGGEVTDDRGSRSFVASTERARKILDKVSPKVVRPSVSRSFSVRASSAPKTTLDKKTSSSDAKKSSDKANESQRSSNSSLNNRNNNYMNLSTSNLSLSSIVSSDVDIKRSNSVFDELMTSFDDDNGSFTSLKSLLKNDPLSVSSPVHRRPRNDQNSDEDLSSPESYKRQDHGKFSGDSAYSSLNRKYSHHGRSTNDVAGRLDEDHVKQSHGRSDADAATPSRSKLSKFCHECGSKFPETAKFCCECGIRRLIL